jgi:hypothetical protein
VAGAGTDIHRQTKAIHHNKIIMGMIEEVEGGCRPGEAVGEDRCKDRLQPMELEADTIKEVVGKAEDILQMVVLSAEEEDQLRWSDQLPQTPAVSRDKEIA